MNECTTPEGQTEGLIDAIIFICRAIDFECIKSESTREALKDLKADKSFNILLLEIGKINNRE